MKVCANHFNPKTRCLSGSNEQNDDQFIGKNGRVTKICLSCRTRRSSYLKKRRDVGMVTIRHDVNSPLKTGETPRHENVVFERMWKEWLISLVKYPG